MPAENVVYIDDRLMFVQVAGAMGIKSIHHTDFESTRDLPADFGLEA